MSEFDIFQTAQATLKRLDTDGFGDTTVAASFQVAIDPSWGDVVSFGREGQMITGDRVVISYHAGIDPSHQGWIMTYQGYDYRIEKLVPFHQIGSDGIDHFEAVLQ